MGHSGDDNEQTQPVALIADGTLIRHYQVIRRLGSGGMGDVYLARDNRLDRQAALKFLSLQLSSKADIVSRFQREARAAARLRHPNIVTIYEADQFRNRFFFAMEYVAGESLDELIASEDLSLNRAIEIAVGVCSGIAAAHDERIIHRDLKPANIIIDKQGQPRLLDFGIAAVQDEVGLTETGTTMGTIAYMSPEQVRGEALDCRSDLFSLGSILYQMLTGQAPYARTNRAATLRAILEEDPRPVTEARSDVPPALGQIISRLLAKSPANRYATAGAAGKDLSDVAAALRSHPATGHATGLREASIAVLPFANLSADPEQEYFCDGIAEDIINDLTQVRKLRVVARTSAFAFKGKNEDVRDIGRQLNVTAILEGSVQKAEHRIRVTAQLINVSDGYHLWSERYDRELQDVFAIQDDIARTIVHTLIGKLGVADDPGVAPRMDTDVATYELYSRGRFALNKRTRGGFIDALALFTQAVERQPQHARAHACLAETLFLMYAYDYMEPRLAIARSRTSAQRAIEIDPNLAEAHTTLAGIGTYYDWNWPEAEALLQQSLRLNDGYATTHQWYAELLSFLKRDEEALTQFRRARDLDPLSEISHIMSGMHHYRMGRVAEAVRELHGVVATGTENDTAYVWLGFALLDSGDQAGGMEQLEKAVRVSGDDPYPLTMLGHGLALLSQPDETRAILTRLQQTAVSEFVSPVFLAILNLDLNEQEQGLQLLEEAVRGHNSELVFLATLPYYRNLREILRVQSLLSVVGLPD